MLIDTYLAMTAAEFTSVSVLPDKCAWMACHFSPYSTGLSNLPQHLPDGAMLILNDRTPIHSHDPERILMQLTQTAELQKCAGVLLDFQQPNMEENRTLAAYLTDKLAFPVGTSHLYAPEGGAVFVPPVPLDMPLEEYLSHWSGREIWLEAALDSQSIVLCEQGVQYSQTADPEPKEGIPENMLHCRYRISLKEDAAEFRLWRTREDLRALLEAAGEHGVTKAFGLYQELG